MTVPLGEVIAALEAVYPPALAEPWDTGIGLTCGDRSQPIDRILLAVDADPVTVAEAIEIGAQLLITHHPLLFRAVQSVAAETDKGALLHSLIRANIAHFAAHTNADRAIGGVNDALAEALDLRETRPLVPAAVPPLEKIVVFVPEVDAAPLITALAAAGAGAIGDYREAAFVSTGTGQFRPLPGASPAIGDVGALEKVAEARVEMIMPAARRAAVVAALRAAHPYEEPAFDVLQLQPADNAETGLGRVGRLRSRMDLAQFTAHVAAALPVTAAGVRAAGDPERTIERVAVCGGAGGGQLGAATASGADAYVTSDLSHHLVQEHVADPARPSIVEVAHWAGEWPWLSRAAAVLRARFSATLTMTVSTRRTDPWILHSAGPNPH